jgi:asparagine synthase (glutamine-hydrolysing)
MCGLAGWSLAPGEQRSRIELESMSRALVHRGPDDDGTYVDVAAGIALAHRRLSIIDLSAGGHQPMASADGAVVLAFNGELYNHHALRHELQSMGVVFRSRSDTEVVLASLQRWGKEALHRFYGMFALAAWTPATKTLLLARDAMGMKPLYYTSRGMRGGVAFASEIKAFLELPGFSAQVNRSSLRQFMEFGYAFHSQQTILEGVEKLPPGNAIEIVLGRTQQPFAFFEPRLADPTDRRTTDEHADRLHATLSEVVREHLVADVPIGLLLSGGLDSSVIAAIGARDATVSTISMGFAGSRVDEREFARKVAAHIGSEHQEVLIGERQIIEELDDVAWYFDDLFADWGTVSTRLLYRACRERGIKAVLVGEGSDELFGGYPVFGVPRTLGGPTAWRLFQLYRRYAGRRYGSLYPEFSRIMRAHLGQARGSFFDALRLFESRNQLPNNYVMKVDKASMSVSVEARAPFLDRRVAELAYGMTERHLLAEGTDKLVLRRMALRHNLLPREIAERPKFGAAIASSWMDDSPEFQRYARNVVLGREGWVDDLGLRGAMTDFFEGRSKGYAFPHSISIFSNVAWRLLLLNLWSRRYLRMPA